MQHSHTSAYISIILVIVFGSRLYFGGSETSDAKSTRPGYKHQTCVCPGMMALFRGSIAMALFRGSIAMALFRGSSVVGLVLWV